MLLKKILILLILVISWTTISAKTFEVRPYEISSKQKQHEIKKTKELKTGLALDVKTNEKSNINYTVAYEGDYMFINDYLEEEKQINNNNIYIGIGYKF